MEGFKGEDFNVYVDGEARRIIVFGSDGKALWLHNTFQLPDTANHDTITYSFDSNVLTLTIPSCPPPPHHPLRRRPRRRRESPAVRSQLIRRASWAPRLAVAMVARRRRSGRPPRRRRGRRA